MNQALHCNLPKANCNSPTFSQPSLEMKIFVSFCNLLSQLAYWLSISCLSTTKYWVFRKIINSKEEDRTKQELFSSTRSGQFIFYIQKTKVTLVWIDRRIQDNDIDTRQTGTTRQRNEEDTKQRQTSTRKRYQQVKKRHNTEEKKKSHLWERNEEWIHFPVKKRALVFGDFIFRTNTS